MSESAPYLREQRRRETLRKMIDIARRLTVEKGLAGFTVEELCEEAGVSRRTFFNYFAAKEDAVLGFPARRDEEELDQAFLAGGAGRASADLTPDLVDDIIELFVARWEQFPVTSAEAETLSGIVEHEPRLHRRVFDLLRESEAHTIRLIERREGLTPGDIRAHTLMHVVGTLNRLVAEEQLSSESDAAPTIELFAARLRERAGIVRDLFA